MCAVRKGYKRRRVINRSRNLRAAVASAAAADNGDDDSLLGFKFSFERELS